MNHLIFKNPAAMVIRISLLILAFLTASMVIGAENRRPSHRMKLLLN